MAAKSDTQELVEELAEEVKTKARKANRLSLEVEAYVDESPDAATESITLEFKPLNVVPLGIVRRTRRDGQEQMWAIFEWAMDETNLALLDRVSSDKLEDLLKRMQRTSGVDLGES